MTCDVLMAASRRGRSITVVIFLQMGGGNHHGLGVSSASHTQMKLSGGTSQGYAHPPA